MDLWQLNIFCKVIELKSFSRAGKAVHLSQPTISSHIKDLEGHLESETPKAGEVPEGDISADEQEDIQERIANDNQLNRAVQILRSWNIFSSMVNGRAQE